MSNVIDGIKLIKHNMGGVNEPDDLTYPFVLDANFRHPEFMEVASAFLYPGGEIIKVRGKTREALDELIELSAQVDEMLSVADRLPAIAKTVSREAVLAADRASKNLYEVALVASARRPENP